MNNSTTRFSSRVEAYLRYRPSYPDAMLEYMTKNFGVSPRSIVADIGSGTGILTGLLLPKVKYVYAVEPNAEMRRAAEALYAGNSRFESRDGTAENTSLPDASVDFITAAQAFHWFEPEASKMEFRRILRRGGQAFLIWNRRVHATPFLLEFELCLMDLAPEYALVRHENVSPAMLRAFFDNRFAMADFENRQILDWNGLLGRLDSTSYIPSIGSREYLSIVDRMREAFDTYSRGGMIELFYACEVYSGGFDDAGSAFTGEHPAPQTPSSNRIG